MNIDIFRELRTGKLIGTKLVDFLAALGTQPKRLISYDSKNWLYFDNGVWKPTPNPGFKDVVTCGCICEIPADVTDVCLDLHVPTTPNDFYCCFLLENGIIKDQSFRKWYENLEISTPHVERGAGWLV